MKTMDELTQDEVEELTTRIINAVVNLLPEDAIFAIVIGSTSSHRATLSNVPPERLTEVFQKAEEMVRWQFSENN